MAYSCFSCDLHGVQEVLSSISSTRRRRPIDAIAMVTLMDVRLIHRTTAFQSLLSGYENITVQCQNCGNFSGKITKRWQWFTFCFGTALHLYETTTSRLRALTDALSPYSPVNPLLPQT